MVTEVEDKGSAVQALPGAAALSEGAGGWGQWAAHVGTNLFPAEGTLSSLSGPTPGALSAATDIGPFCQHHDSVSVGSVMKAPDLVQDGSVEYPSNGEGHWRSINRVMGTGGQACFILIFEH